MMSTTRLTARLLGPNFNKAVSHVRHRHSMNPCRPKLPSWRRQLMLEISKPIFSLKHETTEHLWKDCPRHEELVQKEEEAKPNQLEYLYAMQLRQLMEESAMVGIYHFNSIKYHPRRKAWQNARRLQMELKSYEAVMCREALRGTKYETLLAFLDEKLDLSFYTFSKELIPKNLLQYEKKVPEAFLMAAVFEGRILDRAGIQNAAQLPSLDQLRGQLCSILQMPAQKTVRLLSSNQQSLSTNLKQYMKDQEELEK